MPLGPFAIISLLYLFVGVRVVYQLARNFRQTFDRTFTRQDRFLVDQAAFFVLVPISVALHELGHAVAIWLFGGDVLGFGYYGFAGYVEFDPAQFTNAQQILIASAGTIVNLLLGALAIGLVFLKRPPMRPAYNELLVQFTWISLLNALIAYPLLDFVSGLNGDWKQMYSFSVPWLSAAILVIHVAVLGIMFWAWKSPAVRGRIAVLTGDATQLQRARVTSGQSAGAPRSATPVERTLREAAERVASGWSAPVEAAIQRGQSGTVLSLSWGEGPLRRSVIAAAPDTGGVEISGAVRLDGRPPHHRGLGHESGSLDADRLTMALRIAMEAVDRWELPSDGPAPAGPAASATPAT
jgi:hypothetical protein